MDAGGTRFTNTLFSPDPYFLPGYGGYCPQLKFSMGKSYGKLTAELLRTKREEDSHSQQIISTRSTPTRPRARIPEWCMSRMTPGYTGFIPRRENYFGATYSETCRKALTEFCQKMQSNNQAQACDLPVISDYCNQHPNKEQVPLTMINDQIFSYEPTTPYVPPEASLDLCHGFAQ